MYENVTNHEQAINKLWPSNEQVMKKSRTSHEKSYQQVALTSHEQIMDKLWLSYEQVMKK